jgi:hypothetical protein
MAIWAAKRQWTCLHACCLMSAAVLCAAVLCCCCQAIDLKDCDVYSYKSDGETDPFGELLPLLHTVHRLPLAATAAVVCDTHTLVPFTGVAAINCADTACD